MDAQVRCACCFREELWSDGSGSWRLKELLTEGGGRLPPVDREVAQVWYALKSWPKPAVGPCDGCGMVLIGQNGMDRWELHASTSLGEIVVGEQTTCNGTENDSQALADEVERRYQPRWHKGLGGQISDLVPLISILPPIFMWLFGVTFLAVALAAALQGPPPSTPIVP